MSTNISGLGGVSQLHHGLTGTQQTTQKTGEWNGLKVTAGNDPASLLADAAEELTFAASEKVEKDVSVRKKPDKEKRLAAVAPPEEALAEMQQRMGKRLDELLAKLKSGNGSPGRASGETQIRERQPRRAERGAGRFPRPHRAPRRPRLA